MGDFKIIPAMDLFDGKIVRLHQGDYGKQTLYDVSVEETIELFLAAGAKLIHIVDLEAARTGKRGKNEALIRNACKIAEGRADIELGGGLRNRKALEEAKGLGVKRLIVGTAAVKDPDFLLASVLKYGQDIVVGVDAMNGEVRVDGWEGSTGKDTISFIKHLESIGVREIIFTDIVNDGALKGPAIESLKSVLENRKLNVIASGGVSNLNDIIQLLSIKSEKLTGVIVGKAIYENRINVKDAIHTVESFDKS